MVNYLTGQLNFMSQIVHGNKMTAIFDTNFEGINAGFSAKLNFSIFIHSEAQIVNFRQWSSIPDVYFCPELTIWASLCP